MVCAILESDTVQKIEVLNDASTSLKLNHNHYPALFWMPESQSYILAEQGTLASLVVQWLRICLATQGTRVRSLARKIPHAVGQLSLCSTTIEPVLWSQRAVTTEPMGCNYSSSRHSKKSHNEAHTLQQESNPHSQQLQKSPRTATKAQHGQKVILIKKNKKHQTWQVSNEAD